METNKTIANLIARIKTDVNTLEGLLVSPEAGVTTSPVPVDPGPAITVEDDNFDPAPPAPPRTESPKSDTVSGRKTPKLYGDPRTLAGHRDGFPVFVGTGVACLIQRVSAEGQPDQILLRGINMAFNRLPDAGLSTGLTSGNYGMDIPAGITKPEGYRQDYFENDKAIYFEQSDKPDRFSTGPTHPPLTANPNPSEWRYNEQN